MPGFYGWMLGNPTLRRAFGFIKGRQTLVVEGNPARTFTTIYETHYWTDDESRSGGGSNLFATQRIREALPSLFSRYRVRSVLDVPCGDFNWFKEVKLDLDTYIGGDIVVPLIEAVAKKYTTPSRFFRVIDLTKDPLPECDLILVRDCFIHLSNELIFAALRNITQSKARYLLTTHFADTPRNVDIPTGSFHAVNLCAAPFNFPPPLELTDDYGEGQIPHQVGLWRVDDLRRLPIGNLTRG